MPPRARSLPTSLAAGLLIGAAHLHPALALLAWPGLGALALALTGVRGPLRRGLAWFAAGLALHAIGAFWLPGAVRYALDGGPWASGGIAVAAFLVLAGLSTAAYLPFAWLPPRLGLPLGWLLGELLIERTSGFGMLALLHAQWQVRPVLGLVAWCGWTPALLLLAYTAAACGEGLARGQRLAPVPALLVLAFALALPGIPLDSAAIGRVGAVQLTSWRDAPALDRAPEVLVWPEGATAASPRAEEGPQAGRVILGAFAGAGTQLTGLVLRTRQGPLNAVAAVDRDGRLTWARGKGGRVPLVERPFLGLPAVHGGFSAGHEPPAVRAAGIGVIPLVCYEGLDRSRVRRGRALGGELLAVLASDRPLAHSAIARRQALAAVVLRAVEFGIPAVRASLGGQAAVVDNRGEVLALGPKTGSAVLAVPMSRGRAGL